MSSLTPIAPITLLVLELPLRPLVDRSLRLADADIDARHLRVVGAG